jgi:hypothetical protein
MMMHVPIDALKKKVGFCMLFEENMNSSLFGIGALISFIDFPFL